MAGAFTTQDVVAAHAAATKAIEHALAWSGGPSASPLRLAQRLLAEVAAYALAVDALYEDDAPRRAGDPTVASIERALLDAITPASNNPEVS